MSRIELTDQIIDIVSKMSDGNPGAITAMMEVLSKGKTIDPQGMGGGLGTILMLDTLEIYGTEIYILWNDKCDRDAREFMMLIRANQLGFLPEESLKVMAKDQMNQVILTVEETDTLNEQVCERLPEFQKRN